MSVYSLDLQLAMALPAATTDLVHEAAMAALQTAGAPPGAALAVLITDDATVRRLNRRYRAEDKTTDVLSFPADDEATLPGAPVYLGDIAISLPQAQRQADKGGHSVSAELQLLTVHGILHLLGYDHAAATDKARMWAAQSAILTTLQASITMPPDE